MQITFRLNEKLYLRDPQETELGRRILEHGIRLIDELGFEQFTFRKLAEALGSAEASLYRYFENKHRLLLYLTAWYWSWLEYRMDLFTHPTMPAREKLKWYLHVLTEPKTNDPVFGFIDEEALHRIIVNEQDKTYLTKWVDEDNRDGLFRGYKTICSKMSALIHACKPEYEHANTLASTILITCVQQQFFAEHLPSLTNIKRNQQERLQAFLEDLVSCAIR